MKRIAILGATGSIGTKTLEIIERFPEHFAVIGLTANRNVDLLGPLVERHRPRRVVVGNEESLRALKRASPSRVEMSWGPPGIADLAADPEVDLVVNALVGAAGLVPTFRALEAGNDVALANKESLVMAGEVLLPLAKATGAKIIPVDSEHSAIYQCLQGRTRDEVHRIVLTASGGPFRRRADLSHVTLQEALAHPTWNMGPKVTIDSATLMNKGLEVIEAHWLFDVPGPRIAILIHPQSIVHSMVELVDGSLIAQLGVTDMSLPIQYALSYPHRLPSPELALRLAEVKGLTFEEPDRERFPCLDLAYRALERGGTTPAALNAANEVAVDSFLREAISFHEIPLIIARTMEAHETVSNTTIDDVLKTDEMARSFSRELVSSFRNASLKAEMIP